MFHLLLNLNLIVIELQDSRMLQLIFTGKREWMISRSPFSNGQSQPIRVIHTYCKFVLSF